MIVAYRQPIRPGDSGSDVLAVRRALRKRGHALPAVGTTAGVTFVQALRDVERTHTLTADGIYGPRVHAIVSPSFDAYGRFLYTHAKLRSPYLSPFRGASIVAGRIDQGVDYHGVGPIVALGDATVVGLGGSGWPGGQYLLYRLSAGEHADRYVYVAEAILPHVGAGEKVKAGDMLASFGPGAAAGFYPGIETGWGSATLNLTYAAATGQTGGRDHANAPAGLAFARFLRQLGAPLAYDPGPGPTFP